MLRDLHNHTDGSSPFYSRMQRISPSLPANSLYLLDLYAVLMELDHAARMHAARMYIIQECAAARLVSGVSTCLDVGYYSEPSPALNHFRFSDM